MVVIQGEIRLDGGVVGISTSSDRLEIVASTMNGSIYRCNLTTLSSLPIAGMVPI